MLRWLLLLVTLSVGSTYAKADYFPVGKPMHQERLFCLTLGQTQTFLTDLGVASQSNVAPSDFFKAELAKKVMCAPLSADLTYKGVAKRMTTGGDTYDILRFTGGTKQAELFSWAQVVEKKVEVKPPPALFKYNNWTKKREWQWVDDKGGDTLSPTLIHDEWGNGVAVPAWVKKACCGPEDSHHLRSDQVEYKSDGWHVDGYQRIIPHGAELPSPDGTYWIFYRTFDDGSQTSVYCFFVPIPSM